MSDINTDPAQFLFEEIKTMKRKMSDQRKWIDIMKAAGENVVQQEVDYNAMSAKIAKWQAALEAKGYRF
jgi:hypothetical protein